MGTYVTVRAIQSQMLIIVKGIIGVQLCLYMSEVLLITNCGGYTKGYHV